jgi:hypothetical protein
MVARQSIQSFVTGNAFSIAHDFSDHAVVYQEELLEGVGAGRVPQNFNRATRFSLTWRIVLD